MTRRLQAIQHAFDMLFADVADRSGWCARIERIGSTGVREALSDLARALDEHAQTLEPGARRTRALDAADTLRSLSKRPRRMGFSRMLRTITAVRMELYLDAMSAEIHQHLTGSMRALETFDLEVAFPIFEVDTDTEPES